MLLLPRLFSYLVISEFLKWLVFLHYHLTDLAIVLRYIYFKFECNDSLAGFQLDSWDESPSFFWQVKCLLWRIDTEHVKLLFVGV